MRLAFFAVPALAAEEAAEELNRFLSTRRVLTLDRHLVTEEGSAYWAVCVSYLEAASADNPVKRGKIDYKEVLSPPDFAVFARLRSLRKKIAQQEGVPAYALFTNEQLAAMVTGDVRTVAELAALPGVGPARVERYGEAFLALLKEPLPEAGPDPPTTGSENEPT